MKKTFNYGSILCLFFGLIQEPEIVGSNELPLLVSSQFQVGKSIVMIGRFTYGYSLLHVREWGEGASLNIGSFCAIADNVMIFLGGNHRTDWITTYPFGNINKEVFKDQNVQGNLTTKGSVNIGNDVWIGSDVMIMSGITIGDGVVIAAGSVVTKNIDSYSIVGGNPAKLIRYRFEQEVCDVLKKLRWWDLEIEQIKQLIPDLCACPNIEKLKFWFKTYRAEEII